MSKLKKLSLGLMIGSIFMLSACSGTPSVPHTLEGRSDCLACHAAGTAQAYPEGHAQKAYTSQQCAKCHKQAAGATTK